MTELDTEIENGPMPGPEQTIEELVDAHERALAAVRDAQSEADELAERIKQRVDADRAKLDAIAARVGGAAEPIDQLDLPAGTEAPEPEDPRAAKAGIDGERIYERMIPGQEYSMGSLMAIAVKLGMVTRKKAEERAAKVAMLKELRLLWDAKRIWRRGAKRWTVYWRK